MNFEQDNNGKLKIPMWFIIVIGLMISVASAAGAFAAAQVSMKEDINVNEDDIATLKRQTKQHRDQIQELKKNNAVIKSKLNHIQKTLDELKKDMKNKK